MKKVGIITIHNCKSFGACLQTYGLYQYIVSLGHACEIIDLRRKEHADFKSSKKYKPYYRDESYIVPIKRFVKGLLFPSSKIEDTSLPNFERFYNRIKLSRRFYSVDELYANPPIYDVYVTGSDQVWNPYQPYCIEPYFLTFAPKGKKRVSFAASIGVESVEEKVFKDYKKWLVDYDVITVREKEARNLLSSVTHKPIQIVSDPTFLLDVSTWISLCERPTIEKPYILLFALSFQHELLDYVVKLHAGSDMTLVIIGANQPEVSGKNIVQMRDAGPIDFLSLIHGASMVYTDSFHGTVFSLILGVKSFYTFIAKGNKRGSRITNLLERFGLPDRLLQISDKISLSESLTNVVDREMVLNIIGDIQKQDREVVSKLLE